MCKEPFYVSYLYFYSNFEASANFDRFFCPLDHCATSVGEVKYILSTIDVFSKYVVIYKIKKANTLAVMNKIFKDYIIKFGKPVAIMTDHGTQFKSKKWTDKLRENGIKPIFSSIRHRQSNIVERIHRELGRFFRVYTQHAHKTQRVIHQ